MWLISHEDLKAMNVEQLKDLCKFRGLKVYFNELQAELIILYDDLAANPEKDCTIPSADTRRPVCSTPSGHLHHREANCKTLHVCADNDARRTLSDRHFYSQTRQTARHQGSPYGCFCNFGKGNYQQQGGSPAQQR
ncbi:hypothetical protein BV898_10685 [Hypsibius exemplaris]|uniref:Uncharacterized protein n=1 Tax=Hypsibius exemplaris TaxID=2072580 RepID=A0A1W0WIX4_HYPEX|nr:hypothetical protein BV898_10685 [Hypsibius exemplaris]